MLGLAYTAYQFTIYRNSVSRYPTRMRMPFTAVCYAVKHANRLPSRKWLIRLPVDKAVDYIMSQPDGKHYCLPHTSEYG